MISYLILSPRPVFSPLFFTSHNYPDLLELRSHHTPSYPSALLTVVLSLNSCQFFIHCELRVGLPLISDLPLYITPKQTSALLTLDHAVLHRSYPICPLSGHDGAELYLPGGV
jgi:hypothetical protein